MAALAPRRRGEHIEGTPMANDTPRSTIHPDLAQLDARSRDIFRAIVESYLATGDPVGSRNLSRVIPISLAPASIRNVMQDLESLGLIYAPHTSAGRLPTETGLRLFVDGILEIGDLTETDRSRIEAQVTASGSGKTLEGVLNEASALLSGLSRGAGVVVTSKADARLKHIEFVRLEADRALVVLVSEDGAVENRVVALPAGLPASAMIEAANWLNAHVRGRTLDEARREMERLREERQREVDELTSKVVEAGLASFAADPNGQSPLLIVHGRANLLDNVSAATDLERIRMLFDDLERKNDIIQLLGAAEVADGVRIFIGSENKLFSLSGSSLIAAPFRDRQQKIVGVLGVIGPTRLNYARIVPMVDYTAKVVSRLIG
jgi:heat-inducible transcriptional repressor